jgi:hypothetical protein
MYFTIPQKTVVMAFEIVFFWLSRLINDSYILSTLHHDSSTLHHATPLYTITLKIVLFAVFEPFSKSR